MQIARRLRRLVGWTSHSHLTRPAEPEDDPAAEKPSEPASEKAAGGWLESSDRSQSEVLGTVLILGLSMTAIGIALVGGGVALGDLISDAESSNVENGMSHLSSKASLVALGDADSQRFSLGTTQEGTVTVRPDSGTMTLTNVTNESREELLETELGAIVYEGNNREVAYQSGGIWTKRGDNSTMTSPPEYYYRGTTLTLPIIQVDGEGAVGGQAGGQITPLDVGQDPIAELPTPLEEGTIEIKIQSDYYEGWHTFFSQRADGDTELYHSNETVVTTLTIPEEVTFDTSLSVRGTYDASGNAEIEEPIRDNTQHRSARPLIETKAEEANESGSEWPGTNDTLTAGTYYVDGDLTLSDNLEIDTSDGNVTIVVDGTFDIQSNEITVTDTSTENGVTYYVNGSLRAQGNAYVGSSDPDPQPERNVFYVADGFLDNDDSQGQGGGTVEFEAIVYAADADIELNGNVDIIGSVVANSLDVGGNFDLEYYAPDQPLTVELTGAADLLQYLHVSHNEIRVELN